MDDAPEVLSVSEMVDRLAYLQTMQLLRCAQALRTIRDTTGDSFASRHARRALEEAQIPDPEEDGGWSACDKCGAGNDEVPFTGRCWSCGGSI